MIAPVYVSAAVVVVLCAVIAVAVRAAVREHVATRRVRAVSQRRLARLWIVDSTYQPDPARSTP